MLEAGADKEAKNRVREAKRKNYTHLHMWLTRWFGEYTPCDLFPSLWLLCFCTCGLVPGLSGAVFFCLKVV